MVIEFGEHIVVGYKKVGYAVKADQSGPVLAVYDTIEDAETYGQKLISYQRPARKNVRSSDYPGGRILDCGCMVHSIVEVMTSANGTCCADCYDRMSD